MIFPPNKSPKILNLRSILPFPERIFGNGLIELIENEKIRDVQISEKIKIDIIKGNKKFSRRVPLNSVLQIFLWPKENDGLLTLEETKLKQEHESIILKVNHGDLPNDPELLRQIKSFLLKGKFDL